MFFWNMWLGNRQKCLRSETGRHFSQYVSWDWHFLKNNIILNLIYFVFILGFASLLLVELIKTCTGFHHLMLSENFKTSQWWQNCIESLNFLRITSNQCNIGQDRLGMSAENKNLAIHPGLWIKDWVNCIGKVTAWITWSLPEKKLNIMPSYFSFISDEWFMDRQS